MNENKNQSNELKTNDLTAKKTAPGGGGQILPTFSPLSDWVSQACVRAKLNLFSRIKDYNSMPYPEELLRLNEKTDRGLQMWILMISQIHEGGIEPTKVDAYYHLEAIYSKYFGFPRFESYQSFRTLVHRMLKKHSQSK